MSKITITTTCDVELSDYDVVCIAVTAAEGGINYWSRMVRYRPSEWFDPVADHGVALCDATPLMTIMYENPNEDGLLVSTITPEMIRLGVERLLNSGRRFYDMEEIGGMDAMEADLVIQQALFGDVIYG